MKIVERDVENHNLTVIPDNMDDLYTLYNIIMVDDRVSSRTSRRIKREEGGGDTGKRTTVFMTVKTEETEFHGFGDIIRVRGKIVEASDTNITIGSYHTIKIELYKEISIKKKEPWTQYDLNSLETAVVGQSTGLVIVSLDDDSAIIARVGTHATKMILEINPTIPRKSGDSKQHIQATTTFFKTLTDFLIEKNEEGIADYILIGGPGFTRENYSEYTKSNYSTIHQKMHFTATQSAGHPGIRELVLNHLPSEYIEGNEAGIQAKLIQAFFDELGKDSGKVAYSEQVYKAAEMGSIEHLLVLDTLLRGSVDQRNKIIQLMSTVQSNRGKVKIISSMQELSELLVNFGGLVSILRFPAKFN
ncbi:MAG: mRNA surveillance protein pelota [Candidatus Kariarchaeaceae archaeon]